MSVLVCLAALLVVQGRVQPELSVGRRVLPGGQAVHPLDALQVGPVVLGPVAAHHLGRGAVGEDSGTSG